MFRVAGVWHRHGRPLVKSVFCLFLIQMDRRVQRIARLDLLLQFFGEQRLDYLALSLDRGLLKQPAKPFDVFSSYETQKPLNGPCFPLRISTALLGRGTRSLAGLFA